MESADIKKSSSSTFSASHHGFTLTAAVVGVLALVSLLLGHLINMYSKKRKEKTKTMEDDCNCNYATVETKNEINNQL